MTLELLKSIVFEKNGRLVDYGTDGVIILDCTGRRVTHLPYSHAGAIDETSFDTIRSFFADTNECGCEEQQVFKARVDCAIEVLNDASSCDSFFSTMKTLEETHELTFCFHFDTSPFSWLDLFDRHADFFWNRYDKKKAVLQLFGRYEQLSEEDKDFLYDREFQLFFVHEAAVITPSVEASVLGLAEYGFRIPFVWYIHNKNVDIIPTIIDKAMKINYNSGFALPHVCESFYSKTAELSLEDYLRLLVYVYSKYPFYDGTLYPLNDVMEESLVVSTASNSRVYRWSQHNASLSEVLPHRDVKQAHNFWLRSFLWQRWMVIKAFRGTIAK